MPIELPRGLPFAVDTWTPASALKRHHFLTHAHRDHLAGITTTNTAAVFASRLTVLIARHIFPQLDGDAFVEMELGTPVLVPDPDGDFTVTAFDANHCPGAVMLLFEGAFGSVLHTGDCRLTPDCLQGLPLRHINADGSGASQASCRIDYLFLDCTFARCSLQFPTKEDSIRQVINCIWKQPNAPVVYLVSDMLGQEEILIEVSRVFGSKIYVDKEKNSGCYHTLSHVAPEILTDDASCRFQVLGFPRFSERAAEMLALARAKQQPEPLIIRPSSQSYANYAPPEGSPKQKLTLTEPMRDEHGVWHVCFSMHSSRQELDQALGFLRPKWVISTTPPCLAMELTYVKKHCSVSRLGPDDPLWKLLRLSDGKPTVTSSPQAASTVEAIKKSEDKVTPFVEASSSADSSQVQDEEPTLEDFGIKVEQPVTLFGRARFGLPQDSELWKDEYESVEVEFEAEEQQSSAAESELWKDAESNMSAEVIDLIEVVPKEQDSAIESELWKGCKSGDDVDVIDITEDEVKEHNSSADSELWKDENCGEGVKVIGEGKLEAKEQNLIAKAELWNVCKPRERVELTEEGKNKTEKIEQLSATADHLVSSSSGKSNKEEATMDVLVPSETGKNSEGPHEASCDSSHAVGSSKCLNANLRKLYRSMNVPVPRPLPSLVELMGASKRARVSPVVQL